MNVRYPERSADWTLEGLLSDRDGTLSCGAAVRRAPGLPETPDARWAGECGIGLVALIDAAREEEGNGGHP